MHTGLLLLRVDPLHPAPVAGWDEGLALDLSAAVAGAVAAAPGLAGRVSVAVDPGLADGLSDGVRPGGFDAVVELTCEGTHDPAAVRGAMSEITSSLGGAIDRSSSLAVAGEAHVVGAGDAATSLYYLICRHRDLDQVEFGTTWLERFAPVEQSVPHNSGYRQLHADAGLTRAAAEAAGVRDAGVDGVAVERYPDAAGLVATVRWARESAPYLGELEVTFIDQTRSLAVFTETVGRYGLPG